MKVNLRRLLPAFLVGFAMTVVPYFAWKTVTICEVAGRNPNLFFLLIVVVAIAVTTGAKLSSAATVLLSVYFFSFALYSLELIDVRLNLAFDPDNYGYALRISRLISRGFEGFDCAVSWADTTIVALLPSYYFSLSVACLIYGIVRLVHQRATNKS